MRKLFTLALLVGVLIGFAVDGPGRAEASTGTVTAQTARKHRAHSHSYLVRMHAVRYARSKIGQPYRWGGVGPYGFDCSGLIYAGYRNAGKSIPRTTHAQLRGMRVRHGRRHIGDLVFAHAGHVALYIGRGRVIEAARPGTRIRITTSARFHYATRAAF